MLLNKDESNLLNIYKIFS